MKLRKSLSLVIILWAGAQLFGCAWFQPKEEKTARGLAEEGMEAYRDKDYKQAIESFEQLKDWFPFSQYAILAELKIGDAHYHRKEYEEAIYAYEQFENLHPKNEAVPYVVYQTGRCYFDRLHSIDRDQSTTHQALRIFSKLIRTYPQSPYAKKANDHIRICNKNLAEHEMYVGIFYYKSKHYEAALERFKTVLRAFPDLGVHHKAIEYIPLCQAKIDDAEGSVN
ncbi:MAG: outer membrane protein assembly factor BamD [Deltaproteobacteria bacterium]|nr:outer membrane protein assembly factor BamD [Deltaproteobacteria bacterium]